MKARLSIRRVRPIAQALSCPVLGLRLGACFCAVLSLLLVVSSGIAVAPFSLAQEEKPTEYQVKAAFLYNFAKFVEWPSDAFADPRSPIVLGILGEDPFGALLSEMVAGKTVNGRRLEVRHFRRGENFRDCHILFISSSEKRSVPLILGSLGGMSVLTVGETEGFAASGGTINLFLEQNKVRFEVNVEAATRSRLKISSKLLALARIVTSQGNGRS